ncbi:PIN domain-containing protein [Phenylobacterium sp. SCN 70-31]|uniref:PIN domain-containing protein n=1 Tax=Phenylobacterium sp. SCN 70-31 TaxID=1660129 RepID=UPI000A8E09B1|nr:PIN domain-containing protein [Phenylobacterium sp. SCN 70-31]
MFANRFTALVDACSLAGVASRNLLLTLAEAEFFRLRWSDEILHETERAIARILSAQGVADAADQALRNRRAMEEAFEDAMVCGYADFLPTSAGLPDPKDAHVLAAALKTEAHMIVTENLKDFPALVLGPSISRRSPRTPSSRTPSACTSGAASKRCASCARG